MTATLAIDLDSDHPRETSLFEGWFKDWIVPDTRALIGYGIALGLAGIVTGALAYWRWREANGYSGSSANAPVTASQRGESSQLTLDSSAEPALSGSGRP